jgi:hypothetical protein
MNAELGLFYKANPGLFEENLQKRYRATRMCSEQEFNRFPRGCWGAALVGPSPGRSDPGQDVWRGGKLRPADSKVSIGRDSGTIEFEGNPARNMRWNLLTKTVLGSKPKASALTTVANLDWGHNGTSGDIPQANLKAGCPVVWDFLSSTKPRIIVVMVWATWTVFSDFIITKKHGAMIPGKFGGQPSPIQVRLENCDFDSLVIKAPQHPSRHFFKAKHAEYLRRQFETWLRTRIAEGPIVNREPAEF